MSNIITFNQLKDSIRASDKKNWGILTGNGFNLGCGVQTDYKSLLNGLVVSLSRILTEEECRLIQEEIKEKSYNFEELVGLYEQRVKNNIEKIGLKAIHQWWLLEFVKVCANDSGQYFHSENISNFLDLFQYFFTLNVDPYFYRQCLALKQQVPYEEDANVFVGLEASNVEEKKASKVLKTSYRRELGLFSEDGENRKEIKDGFGRRGKMNAKCHEQNLFYLHGACHLKIIDSTNNKSIKKGMKKLNANDEKTLIRVILEENPETNSAIFANKSEEKLNKIRNNTYLEKQYKNFKEICCQNIVIYGASLADNDKHIWKAINANSRMRDIFISYYEENDLEKIQTQAEKVFNEKSLYFFQSEQLV